ncbi:MAG: metallophosphoesterase [Candidatus Eremiobacteraeota bacterium]|nr:metallophosphoesterase [Candidatus Eremiobacteraeota bacterium]
MKIMAISDIHGRMDLLPDLENSIQREDPAVIVFTGDIVKGHARGNEFLSALKEGRKPDPNIEAIVKETTEDEKFYNEFLEFLDEINIPTFCIPGNMDAPEGRYYREFWEPSFKSENVHVIHGSPAYFGGYIFCGWGGQLVEKGKEDFFVLMYPEHDVSVNLLSLRHFDLPVILLFHSPPVGDLGLEKEEQKGTHVVNRLVSAINPEYFFCGHAHKAQGAQKIGNSLGLNPGALKNGNYMMLDTENRSFKSSTL